MKVPWFAEHIREELILHGWDITGDCDIPAAFLAALAEPWMTTHSVFAAGRPLLAKGAKELGRASESRLGCAFPTPTTSSSARTPSTPPSGLPIRCERPRWKPIPPPGYCCCGIGDPRTHRGSAAAGAETLGRVRRLFGGY